MRVRGRLHKPVRTANYLTLREILEPSVHIVTDVPGLLRSLAEIRAEEAPRPGVIDEWLGEWTEDVLGVGSDSRFPESWDIEKKTSQALYCITRWLRPSIALETGVARGASSVAILAAMRRNAKGQLFSIDLTSEVGGLIPSSLMNRWTLLILPRLDMRRAFVRFLNDMPPIDLFFHDSDHSEQWMRHEFSSVIPRMAPDTLIGSDDVQTHRAFLDAPVGNDTRVLLLDTRKASGFGIVPRLQGTRH